MTTGCDWRHLHFLVTQTATTWLYVGCDSSSTLDSTSVEVNGMIKREVGVDYASSTLTYSKRSLVATLPDI